MQQLCYDGDVWQSRNIYIFFLFHPLCVCYLFIHIFYIYSNMYQNWSTVKSQDHSNYWATTPWLNAIHMARPNAKAPAIKLSYTRFWVCLNVNTTLMLIFPFVWLSFFLYFHNNINFLVLLNIYIYFIYIFLYSIVWMKN